MKTVLLFFYTFLFHVFAHGAEPSLFPVLLHGKVGYIDRDGKLVIPAIYYAGGSFAEGLAPVREGGLYGYIDEKGVYRIPSQFEYALPFQNGFAIVFGKEGKPFYITKDGKQPFPVAFKAISNFESGRALVTTHADKQGLIDTKGKLIIDTAYKAIGPFSGGRAVVQGTGHDKKLAKGRYKKEIGVIDTLGQVIVPFERYTNIGRYQNGYAQFDIEEEAGDEDGSTAQEGFLDRNGRVAFIRKQKDRAWITGDISDGLARINLYKHWLPEQNGILYTTEKRYEGFINLKGEVVINDTTITSAKDFTQGRAFVAQKDNGYFLIDTTGKVISTNKFKSVGLQGFKNGYALVSKDYRWGVINREGEWVVPPTFEEVDEYNQFDDYFFFSKQVKDSSGDYVTRHGVASMRGQIMIPLVLDEYDSRGFRGGLLQAQIGGKWVYIDTSGKIVWTPPKQNTTEPEGLNLDYMNRGYFYATQSVEFKEYNGWGRSSNIPRKTAVAAGGNPIRVLIDTAPSPLYREQYKGYKLTVTNSAGYPITFNAQDSRLNLKLQAMDQRGKWRDIEYLPSSWCGNSYHKVELNAKVAWDFTIPVYEGVVPTKVRAALYYVDPKDKRKDEYKRKEIIVYSNAVHMSINPGQFWRKTEYSPAGLMDPYNE